MTPSQYSPLDDLTMDRLATAMKARNGKSSELLKWVLGLVLAGLVSYFTTTSTMSERIAEVKATEEAHFQELLRRFDVLQEDVREIRSRP